jgi:hypothetical protein
MYEYELKSLDMLRTTAAYHPKGCRCPTPVHIDVYSRPLDFLDAA